MDAFVIVTSFPPPGDPASVSSRRSFLSWDTLLHGQITARFVPFLRPPLRGGWGNPGGNPAEAGEKYLDLRYLTASAAAISAQHYYRLTLTSPSFPHAFLAGFVLIFPFSVSYYRERSFLKQKPNQGDGAAGPTVQGATFEDEEST